MNIPTKEDAIRGIDKTKAKRIKGLGLKTRKKEYRSTYIDGSQGRYEQTDR